MPAVQPPGRPRSEAADAAILDATTALLAEIGWSGLTVEGVAARAGVAKTTVYRRWPGKDELALEAINRLKGPIVQAPGGSVRDDLVFLMETMRKHWVNSLHGQIMRRVAADGNERPEIYRTMRERLIRPRQEVTRAVLERGVAEGSIDPAVDLDLIVSALAAPVVLAVFTHQPRVTRAMIEFNVDMVLRGVAR
ncbi:TetR/AcrR family transcriptional regulator [Jatrophihabitans sp. GAS493]|uniref:TetR/AcrR family transcriptional regulator n=1 Tax=Jatrophihabitans sp. GAS493 TaxID=1907575 RepID=UPI0015606A34|nr:TetR/AcrR family transcriptional regulator [Jatrophihabitans sp. GAS493]